ncbi:polyribonucleotide nucleotidyltransferase [Clostridia bacterium]|nr:polyribonucleotide nucleotidyltransferase [Clostridia bacterium]
MAQSKEDNLKKVLKKSMEIAGREFSLETGKMAQMASGAVVARYGDTMVLSTATMAKQPRPGMDFFPLTVDFEEKMYSAGKIPGGFIKREGRPGEKGILASRLTDRPIRPLFPKGFRNDIQIVNTILSNDEDNECDIVGMIGSSAALHISNAPFLGPIAAVRVGLIDDEYIFNPTMEQHEESLLNLTVAGTFDAVMMVEAGAKMVPEKKVLEAILLAHEEIKKIVRFIEKFREEALALGLAKEKYVYEPEEIDPDFKKAVVDFIGGPVYDVVHKAKDEKVGKMERDLLFSSCKDSVKASFFEGKDAELEEHPEYMKWFSDIYGEVEKKTIRQMMVKEKVRVDGRALDQVRPINCEVNLLPRVHGSALFTRGETQILSAVTLGTGASEQMIDGLNTMKVTKRYIHHYNFPPYSVGETRPMRGPGRREIGHGNLAERALFPVVPQDDQFPYVIRVVSEALSSNGSTSMGSVCGSSMSLMSAGVPISAGVSGIAMGLIKEDDEVIILTDIQGMEDHLGDMDFKVTGTREGVTAMQMDIKCDGIDRAVLTEALDAALKGRMHILSKMEEAIVEPNKELSPFAPKITTLWIDKDKIREVIGPGGKIIKKIVEDTGVEINITDDGRVDIAAIDQIAGQKAIDIVNAITADVEPGKIYEGKVVKVMDFGAFVEVIPGAYGANGKEGLVHISQLDHKRVEKVEDICKEGDMMLVKAIGYDKQGRLKLSRKDALKKETK